jgi:hypothetical protein
MIALKEIVDVVQVDIPWVMVKSIVKYSPIILFLDKVENGEMQH